MFMFTNFCLTCAVSVRMAIFDLKNTSIATSLINVSFIIETFYNKNTVLSNFVMIKISKI